MYSGHFSDIIVSVAKSEMVLLQSTMVSFEKYIFCTMALLNRMQQEITDRRKLRWKQFGRVFLGSCSYGSVQKNKSHSLA